MRAEPYHGGVSTPRPGDRPDVYTLPPEAYRFGEPAPAPVSPADSPPGTEEAPESAGVEDVLADAGVRRRRGWDIALTVGLLGLLVVAAGSASLLAVMLGLGSDGCAAGRVCNGALREVGIWTAFTTPWLVVAIALFTAVTLVVLRRRGFWVPLVGLAAMVALWVVGALLVWAAI